MAFKVIIIVIELMFSGINMFLALPRAHFKMILSGAKNIFMPAKVNSIALLYCLNQTILTLLSAYN